MAETIIRAEGVSKSYLVGHQAKRDRYRMLRDVMVANLRGLARSAMDVARGRASVMGDEIEEFWALKNINFEIDRGEVVGVIGRNGAGKSTLLKILARVTEPSAGRVEIGGRVASLLEVGTGFHPELSGRENIYLNGAILGMSRAEIKRKFEEIVDFAEVERFLDTPVKRYSSGMYVRLAFAVAAHLEPEILIIDEVLAVGDLEFQNKCLGKMKDVAGHGRTVLFVSHNLAAVSTLCTRGILLSGGSIVADGPINTIVANYASGDARVSAVTFLANPSRPSIIAVRVDRDALRKRHLIFDIEFVSPWPLRRPIGGIELKTAIGQPVWWSNGRVDPSHESAAGTAVGTVHCEVRDIPLVQGQYKVSVWLADWYEIYDERLEVLNIWVGADGTKMPSDGPLDWPAVWRVDKSGSIHVPAG